MISSSQLTRRFFTVLGTSSICKYFLQVLVYSTGQIASGCPVSGENKSSLRFTGKTAPLLHNVGFHRLPRKAVTCNLEKTTINKYMLLSSVI